MIRKSLLSICLIFIATWFFGAHILKNRIVHLLEVSESDNFKVSYKNIEISGFPGLWQIKLVSPNIKIIDHITSTDISTDSVICSFDPSFKKATINLGKAIKQEKRFTDNARGYLISSAEDIKLSLKLKKPLYEISRSVPIKDIIKLLKVTNSALYLNAEGKELFQITDLNLTIGSSKNNQMDKSYLFRMSGNYTGNDQITAFKKASLAIDSYLVSTPDNSEENKIFRARSLSLNKLYFVVDDSSSLEIHGALNYVALQPMPEGRFSVSLKNYEALIEKTVPENFIFSPDFLHNIIAKLSLHSQENKIHSEELRLLDANLSENDIKFEIDLSKDGIKIGDMHLMDLTSNE